MNLGKNETEALFFKKILSLLYTFLKQQNLFNRLYTMELKSKFYRDFPVINRTYSINLNIADLTLHIGFWLLTENEREHQKHLVLHQLWRFFLLDNLDKIPFVSEQHKEDSLEKIRGAIVCNGKRNSQLVEEYFEKYKDFLKNTVYE
jgi:hypothetical protein